MAAPRRRGPAVPRQAQSRGGGSPFRPGHRRASGGGARGACAGRARGADAGRLPRCGGRGGGVRRTRRPRVGLRAWRRASGRLRRLPARRPGRRARARGRGRRRAAPGRRLRRRQRAPPGDGMGAPRGRRRAAAAGGQRLDRPVIGRYRWWIGTLLFLSTVINYIDRQTLSVLGPHLKSEFGWTNEKFAWIIIAFRLAYTVMQPVSGRLLDRFGTRNGLALGVLWYSIAAMLTSLATGLRSFCGLRFLLGVGEAANWPGATKAVAEWFPRRERGWAVALFDSGSSFGAAIASVLVPFLYVWAGGWRPAFLMTGTLGFLWLIAWRRSYYPPELHPRLSEQERREILEDRAREGDVPAAAGDAAAPPVSVGALLARRQTLGAIAARGLTDPVWFMITDWFAIYLVGRGFR